MPALMIAYDLNRPGQNYPDLIARIKALSDRWWHHLDSTWFIRTTWSAERARDDLKKYVDSSDELLVMDVTGDDWAGSGFTERAYDSLRGIVNR